MRPSRVLAGVVGFLVIAAARPAARATVIHVDDDAALGGNGLSWPTAFTHLQDALAVAQPGDEIRVAQGTYYPDRDAAHPTGTGDRNASFTLRDGVALFGGYAGWGAPDPDERNITEYVAILSGDIGTPVIISDNSYHVVHGGTSGPTAVLDGVTITGGNASGFSGAGGGVWCVASSPTMSNCTITANTAGSLGGGVYCAYYSGLTLTSCSITANAACSGGGVSCYFSSPTVAECTISGNAVSSYGGGVYCCDSACPTVVNCAITSNTAGDGGGLYCESEAHAMLSNCTISSNVALSSGGGVYCNASMATLTNCALTGNAACSGGGGMLSCGTPSSKLTDCTITDNTAGSRGGGVSCHYSRTTLVSCTFKGNMAELAGGGMYCDNDDGLTVTNCTIEANMSSANGGGVYCWHTSPMLADCTITANMAGSHGGAVYCLQNSSPIVANCILWANTPHAIFAQDGNPIVTYSDIQGGYVGMGNIDTSPLFARDPDPGPDDQWGTPDDDFGDLHLAHGSVCIDAGNNAAVPADVTTDRDGNPRFVDVECRPDTGSGLRPVVDMGAYEAPGDVFVDCNENGIDDLCDVLDGTSLDANGNGVPDECEICRGDLDCSGAVDFVDINAFVLYLSNFPVWQTTYGGCDAANGDIDGNGVYPAFADINAFVTLLSTHSLPMPCGGP